MMPVEYVSRRRRSSCSSPPPGMEPKWSKPTIDQNKNDDERMKIKQKTNLATNNVTCGLKFIRRKTQKKKSLKDTNTTTKTLSRGIALLASPMTCIRSFKNIIGHLETSSQDTKGTSVLVRQDVIGGEYTIVNEICIQSAYPQPEDHFTLDANLSPPNYKETVKYYQTSNHARQNYLQAALKLGDMLERGWLEGDAEDWVKYMEKAREEERKWKEKCRYSHEQRQLARRRVHDDDNELSYCWRMCKWFRSSKAIAVAVIAFYCTCFMSKREDGEQLL